MKQTRRQFLTNASAVGTAIALPGINIPPAPAKAGFAIKMYATRWGHKGSMDEFCKQAKSEGYDGVEDWIPGNKQQEEALFEAIEKYNLSYAALCGSGKNTFREHKDDFSRNLKKALSKKPDFINCHAGRDFFSFDENRQIIDLTVRTSKETGVPIYQETHRGRMLFAAHICADYLKAIPELKLTLDISHWCAVAESLLANQKKTIDLAISRSEHVHARIGHAEGPQVSDPRAPEWQKARNAHYIWWDEIVARKKAAGEVLTVTPEFGPADYMWTTPYTRQPLADQWGINAHMMNEWRKRYL